MVLPSAKHITGAAMAVEDGAALAEALDYARDASDMPRVLGTFETIRRQRTSAMQQASFINGTIWHFPDGPEQQARDLGMRAEVLGEHFEESPNQWSDPDTQKWAYGYDATEAISAELR